MADERLIAERLIACDSSRPDGIEEAAGFVGGWLASRGVEVTRLEHAGLPVLLADAGRGGDDVPNVVFPCAAVHDATTDRLAIYYGAADSSTCVAYARLNELVTFVQNNSAVF